MPGVVTPPPTRSGQLRPGPDPTPRPPRGSSPHAVSPAVYRRRRLAVGLGLLLVVALVWWLVAGLSHRGEAVPDAAAPVAAATAASTASAAPSAPGSPAVSQAVVDDLTAAASAGTARLAQWDPVVLDASRLDALRAAVDDAAAALAEGSTASEADLAALAERVRTETAAVPEIVTSTEGPTTIGGVVIANKTFAMPASYAPGILPEVDAAWTQMQAAAWNDGVTLWIDSGFRSSADQEITYQGYVSKFSVDYADTFSSRPGHSEHQTGLALDINNAHPDFGGTAAATWLAQHAPEYGFVIRFPDGKQDVTGYKYEPWHVRYLGVDLATSLTQQGLTLEEYLNVTSRYTPDA
ncbi:D-alanyl-D-alanine carboxypeptidase family protein [Miniimonas arenae]|uniref:D-alanyl-D-alanine carboxypeptidase family protein n=1 Tax=Miniimonas arenae TaxID=676201 RepID=A0A5C5BGL5_9MICO|nr:M15 family metallopeptidase [Miniimonas arenae]TNU77285.1 D-alanyl-D-alanine carboxypeptidase family protein [Miniimonas arenae]